jgi:hypothetical protein
VALHRATPDVAHEAGRMRRILEEIAPDIARGRAHGSTIAGITCRAR